MSLPIYLNVCMALFFLHTPSNRTYFLVLILRKGHSGMLSYWSSITADGFVVYAETEGCLFRISSRVSQCFQEGNSDPLEVLEGASEQECYSPCVCCPDIFLSHVKLQSGERFFYLLLYPESRYTKWLKYNKKIIKMLMPSEFLSLLVSESSQYVHTYTWNKENMSRISQVLNQHSSKMPI